MTKVSFEDIKFEDKGELVRANFLRVFYFDIKQSALEKISEFEVKDRAIYFDEKDENKVRKELDRVLAQCFNELRNSLSGKKTVYVHRNSGIPLLGNGSFGIVDRGTNLIEVKLVTSCNLKCIYCSVNGEKRAVDFVVEKHYLLEEFAKLAKRKGVNDIEAHIGCQGEPLIYEPLAELIRGLKSMAKVVSMDTNGTMLTEKKVDALVEAGITRFQLSIDAIDNKIANKLAGAEYNAERVRKIAEYIVGKCELMITPILVPGINDDEIPKIIEFAKKTIKGQKSPILGIQNFLSYKFGNNPVKGITMEEFYKKIDDWEKQTGIKLKLSEENFNIKKTNPLPKPFKKGEVVKADIVCEGRMPGEKIAVARERTISIPKCKVEKGNVKLKITRVKHNIFIAELLKK